MIKFVLCLILKTRSLIRWNVNAIPINLAFLIQGKSAKIVMITLWSLRTNSEDKPKTKGIVAIGLTMSEMVILMMVRCSTITTKPTTVGNHNQRGEFSPLFFSYSQKNWNSQTRSNSFSLAFFRVANLKKIFFYCTFPIFSYMLLV